MDAGQKLRHALEHLESDGELDLFADYTESECSVESIGLSEFEYRSVESILGG